MHADNLTTPLTQLEHGDEFIGRHIGPNEHVIGGMLAAIGSEVDVEIRDKRLKARVVKPSFVRNGTPLL
jgi:hypothetical protein